MNGYATHFDIRNRFPWVLSDVPAAMKMLQDHEKFKMQNLPMDLTRDGLQEVLRLKAVAEIDVGTTNQPPAVYVNISKFQAMDSVSFDDACKVFLIFTELMLKRSKDPRHPKINHLIEDNIFLHRLAI